MERKPPTKQERDAGSIPGSGRCPGGGNGSPLQCSCLGNPMDRGAWQATVHGVIRVKHDLATKSPANTIHMPPPSRDPVPPGLSRASWAVQQLPASQPRHGCTCQHYRPHRLQPLLPFCGHMSILFICVSIPALQIGSSVLCFQIPHTCIHVQFSFSLSDLFHSVF